MNKKIIYFLISIIFLLPIFVFGRDNVNYWYIKDFKTEIVLNVDSTAIITEYITADCGNASNKHGIFRVLGTQINTGESIIQMPIELISISDFSGKAHKYTTSNDISNHTITWKIGDPNKTVKGINYYKIVYKVNNVICNQENFDEFYFNVLGNFWDMEIDNFNAKIFLPEKISKNDVSIYYYTGPQGSKNNNLATYNWFDSNTLVFNSTKPIPKNNGITVSLSAPKNIFIKYRGDLIEKDNRGNSFGGGLAFISSILLSVFVLLILPILVIIFCLIIWKKYGDDPEDKRTIIAEYDIPDNLSPILLGALLQKNKLRNEFITAAIVNFAVKGLVKIEENKSKKNAKGKDYSFYVLKNHEAEKSLDSIEQELLNKLFKSNETVNIFSLKNNFYQNIPILRKNVKDKLIDLGYIDKQSIKWQRILIILAVICIVIHPFISVIFLIFSFIMPKKTQKGINTIRNIKGLKLYMETAEKHRQIFYEKEGIFEKLLPYAIVFGMTGIWVDKMKDIYGMDKLYGGQLSSMIPVLFVGRQLNFSSIDYFTSNLNNIISNITHAPYGSSTGGGFSGSSGGGFSGGGGGGGGGGGW